jgi:hypothetical protein
MEGANVKADLRAKKLTTPEVAKRMLRFKPEQTSALLLGENHMKFVPRDVGLFVNLTVLHLNKNQLTNLPDCMASLVKLVTLFAESNQIKQIPGWIGSLQVRVFMVVLFCSLILCKGFENAQSGVEFAGQSSQGDEGSVQSGDSASCQKSASIKSCSFRFE